MVARKERWINRNRVLMSLSMAFPHDLTFLFKVPSFKPHYLSSVPQAGDMNSLLEIRWISSVTVDKHQKVHQPKIG